MATESPCTTAPDRPKGPLNLAPHRRGSPSSPPLQLPLHDLTQRHIRPLPPARCGPLRQQLNFTPLGGGQVHRPDSTGEDAFPPSTGPIPHALTARNVLPRTLVVLAIAVTPIPRVTERLLLLRTPPNHRSPIPRRCGGHATQEPTGPHASFATDTAPPAENRSFRGDGPW